jgi:drug/metabolite transporter (DMT)-like permease
MFLPFLLFALFAAVFTVSKEALYYASPFFLVGFRMCIAGAIMLAIAAIRDRKSLRLPRNLWGKMVLLAITNIYLTNVFEFWGLKYLTAFKTCFLYSLSPFLSALFSFLFLQETMTKKKWIGFIIGFLGFMPILLHQTSTEAGGGTVALFSLPELAVLLAVITSSLGWITLRFFVGKNNISPLVSNGYSMSIGGIMALIHSLAMESWNPIPVQSMMPFLVCSTVLIVVSNGICYNLAGHILKRLSATFMSFVGLTTPLFTALFGFLFLNENTPLSFWISYIIVILGLVVFYEEELQRAKTATA